MTDTPAHTPLPYIRDGALIYALDESQTCNRISVRVEGGYANNGRREGIKTTHAEEIATAEFIVRACNSHDALIDALRQIADETRRKQLPLTALINEIATVALSQAGGE